MARERFDPLAPDPAGLAAAVAVLRRGGVVAYPTDTLYGLAVDPRNDEAVERLFAVKGGYQVETDQELFAAGAANLASGFAGGLAVGAKQPEAGKALLTFLVSPAAKPVISDSGMEFVEK